MLVAFMLVAFMLVALCCGVIKPMAGGLASVSLMSDRVFPSETTFYFGLETMFVKFRLPL